MEKIRIITDSASDLSASTREDLTILPLAIRFGDTEYLDGVTISHHEFYEKLIESDTLPTTSLVSPPAPKSVRARAVADGETVIAITISSRLSGTYQSATIAAEDFAGKVLVIDSYNATIGEGILVKYALLLKDQGLSAKEIVGIFRSPEARSIPRCPGYAGIFEKGRPHLRRHRISRRRHGDQAGRCRIGR